MKSFNIKEWQDKHLNENLNEKQLQLQKEIYEFVVAEGTWLKHHKSELKHELDSCRFKWKKHRNFSFRITLKNLELKVDGGIYAEPLFETHLKFFKKLKQKFKLNLVQPTFTWAMHGKETERARKSFWPAKEYLAKFGDKPTKLNMPSWHMKP